MTTNSHYLTADSESPFAQGAMGSIVLAQDESLGRTVVLKILLDEHRQNRDLSNRFRREASITAQLQHPGIPPVYGAGTLPDSRPFFSMKLVQGRTLAELLSDSVDHVKDRPRFLTIFEQVCQTVAFAHARGVIHRDLKPDNIVVGNYGTVYVMDWGIARFLKRESGQGPSARTAADCSLDSQATIVCSGQGGDFAAADEGSELTIPGELLGTPRYMSPEQARGDSDQDERTDVFSLGVILFEILTGRPLRPATTVQRASLEAFTRAYLATSLSRLDAAMADAPMVSLVRRCLEIDRERRPRSASDVAAEVTAYLLHVLRRPERELARFFELSLDLFCLAGLDGFFKQVNQNFTRVLGYSTEELLTKPFLDLVHPDDCESTEAQMIKLSQGLPVVRFENRYRDRSGSYKWFEWTAKSVPEEGIVFAAARDVTERKHLEQRLEAIVESSPMAMVMTDRAGRIVQINTQAERLFQYRREELVGQLVEVLVPERFRQDHVAHRERFLRDPVLRPGPGRELLGVRQDGTEFPIELGLSPLEIEEGLFVVSVIVDMTERNRQMDRLGVILQSIPIGMLVLDHAGAIRLASKEAERLLRYAPGQLVGQQAEILIPARLRATDQNLLDFLNTSATPADGETNHDTVAQRHDGTEFAAQISFNPLACGDGVLLISERSDPSS